MRNTRNWLIIGTMLVTILACSGCKRFLRGAFEDGIAEFITGSTADTLLGLILPGGAADSED